jgi:AcrR family transcriptional regulator
LSIRDSKDDGGLDGQLVEVSTKTPTPGADQPVARQPLSRGLIVATAVVHVERFGLIGLTMRQLGQSLGVEAMALYRYVPSRDDLLDAMVELLIDEVTNDPDMDSGQATSWQHYVQRLAHGVRRVALKYPRTFPLVASRPPEAPWLRPPLRSVDWVEMFLTGLLEDGFSDDVAVSAYRGFSSFLLGHLLLEVSALGAEVGPLDFVTPDTTETTGGAYGVRQFPTVARLQHKLSEDHALAEFEESLENLLERIAIMKQTDVP